MNVLSEERLTLNEVACHLDIHVSTVVRWCLKGVRGRKLTSTLIGGRRFVLLRDLEAFLAAGRDDDSDTRPIDVRERAKRAGEALDRLGV